MGLEQKKITTTRTINSFFLPLTNTTEIFSGLFFFDCSMYRRRRKMIYINYHQQQQTFVFFRSLQCHMSERLSKCRIKETGLKVFFRFVCLFREMFSNKQTFSVICLADNDEMVIIIIIVIDHGKPMTKS